MTPSKQTDEALLEHMRECIERVREYTKDGREAFFGDEMVQDAVIRRLQTLGQSSIELSQETKDCEKDLP